MQIWGLANRKSPPHMRGVDMKGHADMWKGQTPNPRRPALAELVGDYLARGGKITFYPAYARGLGIDTLWAFLVRELEHNTVAQ